MENILSIFKGFLSDLLQSSGITLALISLFAKLFESKIKLPFDTFLNKYIIALWSICFIILTVIRHYDLHKSKIVVTTELILVITGLFYAKRIFSSEINILMMKIILVLFFIEIVL